VFCVAVPNDLTRAMDLSRADRCIDSLEGLSLDDVVARAERRQRDR
jgi:hypothetical protein